MGSDTSTVSAVTGTSSRPTSTESSHGTGTEGDRDGSSTTDEAVETGDDMEPAAIHLFASQPVQGQFGALGTLSEAAASRCNLTLRDGTADLECAQTFAIVGSNLVSLSGLRDDHPELEGAVFEGPDGVWLADSYDAILDGDVPEEFNPSVFSVVGGMQEEVFWWGGGDDASNDCEGWNVVVGQGDARRFQLGGPNDDPRACNALSHLLCACVPVDG